MKKTIEQEMVDNCKSLDELCNVLNNFGEPSRGDKIEDCVDFAMLPIFGGVAPQKTSEVWSWDEKRILVAESDGSWGIENRCACGEATFHCRCK